MLTRLGAAALICLLLTACSNPDGDERAFGVAETDESVPGPDVPACDDIWNVGSTLPAYYFEFSCTFGDPERLADPGTKCRNETVFRFEQMWAATPDLKVHDVQVDEPPC